MRAQILEDNSCGGIFTDDYLANNHSLVSEWELTEILPNQNVTAPFWDGSGWIECPKSVNIPIEVTRMNFIIHVFLVTGLKYEDIVSFIQNLPQQHLDDTKKYIVLTKLRGCVYFERYSEDLLMVAQMMNITSEQLDEIFINGNS